MARRKSRVGRRVRRSRFVAFARRAGGSARREKHVELRELSSIRRAGRVILCANLFTPRFSWPAPALRRVEPLVEALDP